MTYDYDFKTEKYGDEPSIIIKKNKIDDLNIKSTTIRAPGTYPSISSDMRLSCSTETHVHLTDSTKIGQTTWKSLKISAMSD